ncbi:MAG: hypothetical protein LDLANPLL_02326 [Turneriella sp.]|nr:hypothetical protein [Turneriella sp.]
MAEALVEERKIKDDEFDIHGDLAVSEADDKSFVILYDSSKEKVSTKNGSTATVAAHSSPPHTSPPPTLEDLSTEIILDTPTQAHAEDAYIDDILSSDDIDAHGLPSLPPVTMPAEDEDGPITLSNEELDGILNTGPDTDEEFHPDFPANIENTGTPPMLEHGGANFPENSAIPDDELPISLSDEDLDEILLEEKGGGGQAKPQTAPSSASPQRTPSSETLDDEEPIALSDDELDTILADAEASQQEEPHLLDNNLGLEDTAPPVSAEESRAFFDSDDDEPITLSDDELHGILESGTQTEDVPLQTEEMALESTPVAPTHEVEDDEPIALSHDELDGILMDADEAPIEHPGEVPPDTSLPMPAQPDADEPELDEPVAADAQGFFEDTGEDESITLSADELDGIAASATPEEAQAPSAGEAPSSTVEEDDGPIALSLDELEGIAADAHEVTPEAPMVPLSPMDTGAGEKTLEENTEKPATVFEEDLESATLVPESDIVEKELDETPDTTELKSVMEYLDNLLGELPDDVIEKFAQSEYFKLYQKIMDKLGL